MGSKHLNQPRALLSATDKHGIDVFAQNLLDMNWEVYATSGTKAYCDERGVNVKCLSELIGSNPTLNGRLKTLDARLLGGLLWDRRNAQHNKDAETLELFPFDILVSSFYNFELMKDKGLDDEKLVDFIDVGGPAMLRASAKNYHTVLPVVDKEDYQRIICRLQDLNGDPQKMPLLERKNLARKAFNYTLAYDQAISNYFSINTEVAK